MKRPTESHTLATVAAAQGALFKLTKALLQTDKMDGLWAAEWTRKHAEFYREFRDEMLASGRIEDHEGSRCDALAYEV